MIIVSGVPRSGTSMIMRALSFGGIELVEDGKRKKDKNNDFGYFEIEKIGKKLKEDPLFLKQYKENQAIKIISSFINRIQDSKDHLFIIMQRNWNDIFSSMARMTGKEVTDKERECFQSHFLDLKKNLIHKNYMILDYDKVIKDPQTQLKKIKEKVLDFNVEKAIKAISPPVIDTSIIIPTLNHLDDLLKPCIESIIKYTDFGGVIGEDFRTPKTEVIVVANGCTDGTEEYVKSLGKNFVLLTYPEPLGYTKATNKGIEAARGEHILFLNNDTTLLEQNPSDWIERLKKPFKTQKKVGVTGPLKANGFQSPTGKDFVVFFCAMTKKSVIDEIGMLDERFSPGGAEDIDFCIRAEAAGYEVVQTSNWVLGKNDFDFPICHDHPESTMHDNPDWDNVFLGNLEKLREKYKETLEDVYNFCLTIPTETKEHFPTLRKYASKCSHITEMGVRDVFSTYAFLVEKPERMVGYDIYTSPHIEKAKKLSVENGIKFDFLEQNVLTANIEETDLLFIDTAHTYHQLSQELKLHGGKVKKYIILHDTETYKNEDEERYAKPGQEKHGLEIAIQEFLEENEEWEIIEQFENSCGLTILEKKNQVFVGYQERAIIGKNDKIPKRERLRYEWGRKNIVGKKILEIGCSSGYGLRFFNDIEGIDYLGIDKDKETIKIAKDNFGDYFQVADINDFDLQQYDTIVAFEILEHLENGKEIAQKLKKHCKRLIATVPYKESYGYWGPFHKIHEIEEKDFPGFKYEFLNDEGEIGDKAFEGYDDGLMLMKWEKKEFKCSTSIIIPTFNHLKDLLKPCVESLIKYTNLEDKEIIIVANGCNDGTEEYVNSLGNNFVLLNYPEALGYTKAVNAGIEKSTGEYIVLLNNDTTLVYQEKDQWINILKNPFKKEDTGITGPVKNYCKYAVSDLMIFYCVMIKRSLFDEIGLLDEDFSPGCGEDTDFCAKAENKGYQLIQVDNLPVVHKSGQTFADINENPKIFNMNVNDILYKNRIHLINKHGKGKVKLNIGCGDRYFDDHINMDKFHPSSDIIMDVMDMSQLEDNVAKQISAIHVLEHTPSNRALNTLKEWNRVLAPGGKLVIELPDIEALCARFANANKEERYEILTCIYGHNMPHCPHLFGWHEEIMIEHLSLTGFERITREKPIFDGWGSNMRYECYVPEEIKSSTPDPIVNDIKEGITVVVSTKDRYNSTLPLTLVSIANQTLPPKKVLIFDDGEQKSLPNDPLYRDIFYLMHQKGIESIIYPGERRGQVANYNKSLQMIDTEFIWRIDDDEIAENDALEKMMRNMKDGVGAVGGVVLDPKNVSPLPEGIPYNKIDSIRDQPNIQWFKQEGIKRVDHLYSSFLFRKEASRHGFCMDLSPAGHREETIFTHSMRRGGWILLVDPEVVIWHFRNPEGGIRTFTDTKFWEDDEKVFDKKIEEWKSIPALPDRNVNLIPENTDDTYLIVLNNGIGDHIAFSSILPEILKKYNNVVLAVCYEFVFEDFDVPLISIAEANARIPGKLESYSVYMWMVNHNWKKSIVEAYREMYINEKDNN